MRKGTSGCACGNGTGEESNSCFQIITEFRRGRFFGCFVFDFIGMSTLVLPGVLAQMTGCDGLFAILLGGGMSSIYLWYLARAMKEMDGDLTGYMKKSLPVWLYFFLYVLLIVHCIIEAGYGAYVFADVMKKALWERKPIR